MKPPGLALLVPALALLGSARAAAGLAEATDHDGTWTSGSYSAYHWEINSPEFWEDQPAISLDGVDAAAGRLHYTNAEMSWIQTTVSGPTTLYFSWRADDFTSAYSISFSVLLNGSPTVLGYYGSMVHSSRGWREEALVIPAGNATVSWQLNCLRGATGGRAYVDQVWTSDDPRPRITATAAPAGQFDSAFSWEVPVNSATTATLEAAGLPPGLSVDPDTRVISGTPAGAGTFEATLTARNGSGQHVTKVKFEIEPGSTTVAAGLDFPAFAFTQPPPGTAWTGVTGFSHDGVDSARGVAAWQENTNILSTAVNGPGSLTFWYRCTVAPGESLTNSGPSSIYLYVGVPPSSAQPTHSFGATTWTKATVAVPAGPLTISWHPHQAPWVVGQGYCYLDEVGFIPSTVLPQPTFAAWQTAWNVVGEPAATDTDGDGLTLAMEYALGGSPYVANPQLLPVVSISGDYFTIEVTKARSPTDLAYTIQASKDLVPNSWTASSVEVLDEDGTHLLARCKKPISEQPISYLRLKVLVAP